MFFQIQEILINTSNSTFQNLCSGFFGSIVGAFITCFTTWLITKNTNNENKKQWRQELFNKRKSEYVLKVILKSADLHTITSELTTINKDTVKILNDFHIDDFQKFFNILSKMNIFFSKNDELHKYISKILNDLDIYLNLLLDVEDIIDNKQKAYYELAKLAIITNSDEIVHFAIVNYIEYIECKHDGVWLCDGKKYALYEEFQSLYGDKFELLIKNIQNNLLKLHDYLIDKYIII